MDVAGLDVSWMAHGAPKDKASRPQSVVSKSPAPLQPMDSLAQNIVPTPTTNANATAGNGAAHAPPFEAPAPLPPSTKRAATFGNNAMSASRRNSWLSSMASRLSGSANGSANGINDLQQPQNSQQTDSTPKQAHGTVAPRAAVASNSKAQPGNNAPGGQNGPASARASQPGVFGGLLRRFSTSGGMLGGSMRGNHGIVERRTLNIDKGRERCPIAELGNSRLRKVAFCVDVEIAPQPRYAEVDDLPPSPALDEKSKKRKMEKSEAAALKNPKAIEAQKEADGVIQCTGEKVPKEPPVEGANSPAVSRSDVDMNAVDAAPSETTPKQKKKRKEEERKERKAKKKMLAQASGSIPMEIRCDSDSSSRPSTPNSASMGRTALFPTMNPVRIYRRCCQLRESHILKMITEQLSDPANVSAETGLVDKLDLTGYWLQLDDLRTLGDYLAVVAVREVVLENCGITDEGLRCVLSGLLAAKQPEARRRRITSALKEPRSQIGGMVERLVLKSNDIGVDGWKHICLFIYMCRSIRSLDLSHIRCPQPTPGSPPAAHHGLNTATEMACLFARCLGERLAGSSLELLGLNDIRPTSEQLGIILTGAIECGVRRLGLANNALDTTAVGYVAKYLGDGRCEGLDLSGNDLRGNLPILAASIGKNHPLWALSLSDCNLTPSDINVILPVLVKLDILRFLDLSHNDDLCRSEPSAIPLLRKYLPKISGLKRIHLANMGMTYEQAICIVEILPDITNLAYIKLLENPALVKLADAHSPDEQEEACALYASLLTATNLSKSIAYVDIEFPGENSSELVKAMAKQTVAYCLRNMERETQPGAPAPLTKEGTPRQARLLNVMNELVDQPDEDEDQEPDDAFMIGGTGVAKALSCCLRNGGNESRRVSVDFSREGGSATPKSPSGAKVTPAKAKEMSKQLLASARKIRTRIQPALSRVKADPKADPHHLRKLVFLDQTLQGIIKRFEDEFPETRVASPSPNLSLATTDSTQASQASQDPADLPLPPSNEGATTPPFGGYGNTLHIRPLALSRTISSLSITSRAFVEEEGRMHRAGHRFRQGITKPTSEHYEILLQGVDGVETNERHLRMLEEFLEDLGPELCALKEEKGAVRTIKEHRELVMRMTKEADPEHWGLFAESQEKARANTRVGDGAIAG